VAEDGHARGAERLKEGPIAARHVHDESAGRQTGSSKEIGRP
jgi:hypothetical protein